MLTSHRFLKSYDILTFLQNFLQCIQMDYLVKGYRFITPQKLEIHKVNAAKICIQQNI